MMPTVLLVAAVPPVMTDAMGRIGAWRRCWLFIPSTSRETDLRC